ncbi:rhomboid family intramembrane serine protease [Chryseobacterium wanjuense]
MNFLIPHEGLYITLILIYINVVVFLLMFLHGVWFYVFLKRRTCLQWGANYGSLAKEGQWWRLVTCTFLHGGIMHLFTNMYGLLFVGIFLEPLLGKKYFLIIYLAKWNFSKPGKSFLA